MESSNDGPDATSIKPVSSLRSRFENLDKDAASGTGAASPGTVRSRLLPTKDTSPNGRPSTSHERKDAAVDEPELPKASPTPAERRRRLSVPKQRPHSMINVTPAQHEPPLLTIDSPESPNKSMSASPEHRVFSVDSQPRNSDSGVGTPARPFASKPDIAIGQAPASPILSSFPDLRSRKTSFEVPSPVVGPPKSPAGAPPPVNRAGKPQIPSKPAALTKKLEGLSAPVPQASELSDRSVSPFNTPPSSGPSSPAPGDQKQLGDVQTAFHPTLPPIQQSRKEPDLSSTHHSRADSDASFVERLRSDSNASSLRDQNDDSNAQGGNRAKASSNASFVRQLSPPKTHRQFPPAAPQAVRAREQSSSGLARTATLPSRSSPRSAQDASVIDDRPRIPYRPELQMRPGRTSPHRGQPSRTSSTRSLYQQSRQKSNENLNDVDFLRGDSSLPPRMPTIKPTQRSALTQGFDGSTAPAITKAPLEPPAIPAPRRSVDRRRDPPPPPPTGGHSHDDVEDITPFDAFGAPDQGPSDFPDASQASRRPPRYRQRPWHIGTEYDTKVFATCAEFVCTGGYQTRVWNTRTGERLVDIAHNESKVTSIVFKPSTRVEDEGKRIWLGTNTGEIHELDVPSAAVTKTRASAHPKREVVRMFRYAAQIWSLDDSGELAVWTADSSGLPSLDSQCRKFRTSRANSCFLAVGPHLWVAAGREIRVFAPGARSDTEFQVLREPLSERGTGDICSAALLSGKPDLVYFGHQDGKVSIYNRHDFSCAAVVNVSVYKISSLAGVGDHLWVGFNTGMIYVYDTTVSPWRVMKDWQAHEKQICGISTDRSAFWKFGRMQVVSLGTDNMLRIWDGMLEEDWMETRMHERDSEYCSSREISAAVMTWNAGACKPSHLQQARDDSEFLREYLREYLSSGRDTPEILVFGFQELVDLENKKVTAKSFFKSKKKDSSEQEHMSHQYRAWRDHLTRSIEQHMPRDQPYSLLHTASLVGLFTCVFVKADLRKRIRHVHAAEIKRGMGGLHGNKGALVLRMTIDDSSLCLVNCHLAAGQTQTLHRNNDIAGILEADCLPPLPIGPDSTARHADVFAAGGDGSMILDHEICILNGDLNYRIDTMGRDSVIKHVRERNLARLLERDQLLLCRKKNPGFRLRAFHESPITFAPTYKYNPGTDEYDTSEKKRAPAWCDRILYRGLGKVKMEEYRRWEVRVSDHRPVSGRLRLRIKTVDPGRRERVWELVDGEFEAVRRKVGVGVQLQYLVDVLGLPRADAARALKG